jgi:hypothetical protein
MISGIPSRMRHPDLAAVLSPAPAPAPMPRPDFGPGRMRGRAALLASLQQGTRHG